MAKIGKLVLIGVVALVVCLGLGFAWGRSGRVGMETAVEDARRQLDAAEGRGQLLDARVSLYNNNFGDASRHLEEAKATLGRVKARYLEAGRTDAATRIDAAVAKVDEAQRLAGKLDPSANARVAEALETINAAGAK